MGQTLLSDLVGRDQLPPLIMALGRLTGLPVALLDGNGTVLDTTGDSSGEALERHGSGFHWISMPIEAAGERWATLILGPYRSTGRRRAVADRGPGEHTPVLSKLRVEVVKARTQTLAQLLVDMGLRELDLRREREERRKAEAALLARESQYRTLVEQINEGMLAGDTETRITFVNPRMLALLGYTEEEMLGRPFHAFVDPAYRAAYLAHIERRKTGVAEQYETVLLRKDGSRAWFQISASPMKDEQGQHLGSFGVMSDISERKAAEEALRLSEEKFRGVFESMQDVYYRCDREGRLTLMSPSGAGLLGYPSTESLVGRDIGETLFAASGIREGFLREVMDKGAVRDYETVVKCRDGSRLDVAHHSHVRVDEQGICTGIEGVFFDITERKRAQEALRRSEERYRLIVDNVQDILFTHLPDGTVTFVSSSVRHLGYAPEDIIGRNMFEFVYVEDLDTARAAYLQTLATLRGSGVEVRVLGRDGTCCWMEEFSDPVLKDGALLEVTCVLRDITQRKKAEEALRLSEEKYRRIINNIQDVIYSYLPDGRIVFASESVRRLGYEPEDLVGLNAFSIVHAEDADRAQRGLHDAIASGTWEPFEVRVMKKGGGWVWFEENREPIFQEGRLVQVNAVARDITDRHRAEAALRESEEKYRWLVEQLSEGIMVSNCEDTITFVNPRMAEMLGYSVSEMVGRKDTFMQHTEGELLAAVCMLRPEGGGGQYETQCVRKNGDKVHFLVSGTSLRNAAGQVVGSFGVYSDITEWKKAEEELKRLSAAIEQASDSIVIADIQGMILYANTASQSLTGFSLDELVGQRMDRLRSVHQTEAFYAELWETLMQGGTWSGRLSNVRKDGSRYETTTTLSPVRDRIGRIQYVVTSSRDVTRETELEIQLRHSQRMEAIGVMAGGIAHDFNNILTPVMGYAEMALARPGLEPKLFDYLQEIASAGRRAAELVQQILTFSRQSEQPKHPIQVASIVKESLKLIRAAIPSTITIRKRIGAPGLQTLGDASQIHQVVMNLCTNAFHAMRDTGGILEVNLDEVDLVQPLRLMESSLAPGRYLRLRVSDSGNGMEEEVQKKIFLPFFTTKRIGEGTGLGLSIVHGIVVGMGGSIQVESEPGKGSAFTVYLPVIGLHSEEACPQAPAASPGSERLCVVDDEDAIGSLLHDALSCFGYQVQVFDSSFRAWSEFQRNPEGMDLIITDLTMPELTGVELAQRVWTLRPDLPVVLMTGYTESLDEASAHEIGFATLLRKPVPLTVVGQTVRSILDQKKGGGSAQRDEGSP